MGLGIDIEISKNVDVLPVFKLQGSSLIHKTLFKEVKFDLEMISDDAGNPVITVDLPDRAVEVARSVSLPGEIYFALLKVLGEGAKRGRVELVDTLGKLTDISSAMSYCLFDFSGSLARLRRLSRQRRYMEALREAKAAVESNPGVEGYRVILARLNMSNGKYRDAKLPLNEELEEFPNSYKAYSGLAELEYKDLHLEQALEHLHKATEIYPNHVESLLLLSDILLKLAREGEAVSFLARALFLRGSLDPVHVQSVLKRRLCENLFGDVLEQAANIDLGVGFTSETEVVAEPVSPSKPVSKIDCCQVTAEDVVRLAAREVFRDGAVTPGEKGIFQKICAHFPVAAGAVSAIVEEEKKALKQRGVSSGDFNPELLFRGILEKVYGDGKLSPEEGKIIIGLAGTLGLSKKSCLRLKDEVLKGK